MVNVKVVVEGSKVFLTSPYVPEFNKDANGTAGIWNKAMNRWEFPASQEQRVRDLARKWWGTDGEDEFASDIVTVRVDFLDGDGVKGHFGGIELYEFGRLVAKREARDVPVRLGEGVILVSGGFPNSGGSVRNVRFEPRDNTVIEVLDVPRNAVPDNKYYRIIEAKIDREALAEERERLIARLAEIDKILNAEPAAAE